MNGGVTWRGARENDALSLQVCVEALTNLELLFLMPLHSHVHMYAFSFNM